MTPRGGKKKPRTTSPSYSSNANVNLSNALIEHEDEDEYEDERNAMYEMSGLGVNRQSPTAQVSAAPERNKDTYFPAGDDFTNLNVFEKFVDTTLELARGQTGKVNKIYSTPTASEVTTDISSTLGDKYAPEQKNVLMPVALHLGFAAVQNTIDANAAGTGGNTTSLGLIMAGTAQGLADYQEICRCVYAYHAGQFELSHEDEDRVESDAEAEPPITPAQSTQHKGAKKSQRKAQEAAIEALTHGSPEVERMKEQYCRRRDFVVRRFNEMGLSCHLPRGSFYAFPEVAATGLNEVDFCHRLLREKEVAVVPGTAFGSHGKGHVRASFSTSYENLVEATDRMESFLETLASEGRNQEAV